MATSTRMANEGSWPRHRTTSSAPRLEITRQRAALLRLLRAQQEVLREHRRWLREAPPLESVVGADDEERAAQEFEAGLDIALLEMRARQCQEIETALHLLESGSYGRCIDCEEPILPSRLLARPFAVRCRACQEALEKSDDSGRDGSRTAPLTPTREDLALGGSGHWPRSAGPTARRKHGPVPVSVRRPLSLGGVSL
jgi:RNA polymerase-binding transcription factor